LGQAGADNELYWHMAIIGIGVLLVVVVVWLAAVQARLRKVSPRLKTIIKDLDERDVLSALRDHAANLEHVDRRMDELQDALAELFRRSRYTIQKVGMVRFDALKHVGGALSFAVALLDGRDDGVILTSIYSLEECRTYAKRIVGGKCEQPLSDEEQQALREALAAQTKAARPEATPPREEPKMTRSRGFTLIELLVVIAIISILASMLMPVFHSARQKALQAACISNVRQLAMATSMYMQDLGHAPGAQPYGANALWPYDLQPYLHNEAILQCPATIFKWSYVMNGHIAGRGTHSPAPSDTLVLYDGEGFTLWGSIYVRHIEYRHNGGVCCSFLDGHAKWYKAPIPDYFWTVGYYN